MLFCCSLLVFSIVAAYATEHSNQNELNVKYAGNTADPYIVMVDSGDKYTISQSYSWVRDQTSRYNLVSYSIDNGDFVEISRKARGDFTLDIPMDSSHSVTFLAVIQYPISMDSNSDNLMINFSPASPTHDNWFDANSEVIISVPYTTESSGTRQQLASWSIDKSNKRIIQSDDGSDNFTTEITVSRPYNLEFISKTQHYVNVISEYGQVSGSGWYDASTTANISIKPPAEELLVRHSFAGWEGSVIESEGYSALITVDSAKTLMARWTTDYSQLLVLGIGIAVAAGVATVTLRRRSKTKALPPITNSAIAYETSQQAASTVSIPSPPAVVSQQDKEPQQNNAAVVEQQAAENNTSYQNQIMEYAMQKSIERLEAFRSSGVISDAKFARIKEKLERTFH